MSPYPWNLREVFLHTGQVFCQHDWCMEASQICDLLGSPCMPSADESMDIEQKKLSLGQPRKSYIKAKVLALITHPLI